MKNHLLIVTLTLLTCACATSPKKNVENDITEKEIILASIKYDASFTERWNDSFVDKYIEQEETSPLASFLSIDAKNTEFKQSEKKKKRQAVRNKLKEAAKAFDTNMEYLYKYHDGIILGEYNFQEQKFPLLDFGDFFLTYNPGYYPGALFINFPKGFKPELFIEQDKAQAILNRSMRRSSKQHRRVYPMITFKLVSASPPDVDQQQKSTADHALKRSKILDVENRITQMEQSAGLPPAGQSSKSSQELQQLNQQDKADYARHGERLDAVVTSLIIYSRPFEFIAYQEILYKAQFPSD